MTAITTAPLAFAELPAVAVAQLGDDRLLPHLRWCLCTPHATVLRATAGGAFIGVGTALAHTGSGWILSVVVHPQHRRRGVGTALVRALLHRLEEQGCTAQRVVASAEHAPLFHREGFTMEGELVQYSGGTFHEATRDEVIALAPEHLMGVLHLDRRATGEDRRRLLLEHLYLGMVYAEQGRVRGFLLPLLSGGTVIAEAPSVGFELLRWLLPLQDQLTAPAANDALRTHLHALGHHASPAGCRLVRGSSAPFRPLLVHSGAAPY